jgi:hypothetical protein
MNTKKIAAALSVQLVGWSVAWVAGYDFDYRSPEVAFWYLLLLVLSVGTLCLEELE